MKFLCCLLLPTLLFAPYSLHAAGQLVDGAVSEAQPVFSAMTMKAFDRSGHEVIHSKRVDGSKMAEHHGTLGHVTLARIGADGNIETYCTSDETAARTWMAGGNRKKPVSVPSAHEVER